MLLLVFFVARDLKFLFTLRFFKTLGRRIYTTIDNKLNTTTTEEAEEEVCITIDNKFNTTTIDDAIICCCCWYSCTYQNTILSSPIKKIKLIPLDLKYTVYKIYLVDFEIDFTFKDGATKTRLKNNASSLLYELLIDNIKRR